MTGLIVFALLVPSADPRPGDEVDWAPYYDGRQGDAKVFFVPLSRRALTELGEYSAAKDGDGIAKLVEAGRVLVYKRSPVKVRVISLDRDGVTVRFRLLAGPGEGEEAYGLTRDFGR